MTSSPRPALAVALLALVSTAHAHDATALVSRLHAERCVDTDGELVADPRALVRERFALPADAPLNAIEIEPRLWLGAWGERGVERYLIFVRDGDRYRVEDCIPFHPMSRRDVEIDGGPGVSMAFGIHDRTPRGYDMVSALYRIEGGRHRLESASIVDPFLYEKGIDAWDEPVADPWYWAEVRFSIDSGGDRESMWGFELDLDHDGTPELGITTMATHGTGGGEFAFFRRAGESYRFIGYLGLKTLLVLAPGEDGGLRVATYWHINAACGVLAIHGNDGRRFHTVESSRMCGDAAAGVQAELGAFIVPGRRRIDPPPRARRGGAALRAR